MKKILHILQSDAFSGAENVVCQIINMMENNENIQMAYCSRDGQIRTALVERNIQFFPISKLTIKEIKRIIKEYNPDIIHAHDMRASFVAALACRKIPIISHIHNNSFDSRGISIKAVAYLYAAIKAKKIFWVSDSSYKGYIFHKLFKNKSEVLYNIINIDNLYSKMERDKNNYTYDVVYLGRLSEPKNPKRLMKICRGLADKLPTVKIAVIGTGELSNEIHEEAKKLKLTKNVSFLGFRSNPYKMLYDSKVMIMTSLWEGTPMCVLEAMSLGVPVVSTPTDGVSIVVENEKTGYLTDDDKQLVKQCLSIIENDELHDLLSKNSIIRAKKLMDRLYYRERLLETYQNCSQR